MRKQHMLIGFINVDMQGRFYTGAHRGPVKMSLPPPVAPLSWLKKQVFLLLVVIMNRGRDISAFFAPLNKKVRKTYQVIERAEELEEGEPEPFTWF